MPQIALPALVFDLDGTLIDSGPGIAAAVNAVLGDLGRPSLDAAQVRRMVGEGARRLLEQALEATGGRADVDIDSLIDRWEAAYAELGAASTVVYPGVAETLAVLRAEGAKMAVCTNKPRAATRPLLDALGLLGYFDAIVAPEDAPARKPDGRHVLAAVATLGATPDRAVYIGDSEIDAAAARNAHVPFVLVTYGYARVPLESLAAAARIDTFSALPAALAALETDRVR